MIGDGRNKKSMGYVRNLSSFLTAFLNSSPGEQVYNYADKPDLTVNELIEIVHGILANNRRIKFRIPYSIGLLGGYVYDFLAKITGRTFPISSVRIKKFCANTILTAEKLKGTGFIAPYTLEDGLKRMIQSEFYRKTLEIGFTTGEEH
jgi:nucleoside-diphosphate-sugar epimerase